MTENSKQNKKFPGFSFSSNEKGDVYPTEGFWMCPMVLDEYWKDLNKSELKLLLCILRKIIGWDKKKKQGWDYISQSQFRKYTGLSKNSITTNGMKGLIEKGFVREGEETMDDGTKKYELVMFDGSDDGSKNNGGSDFDQNGSKSDLDESKNDREKSKSIHTIDTNNIEIEKNILQIFSFFQEKVGSDFEMSRKVRKLIRDRLADFDFDEGKIKRAIYQFSCNEWYMEKCANRGPEWFFAEKNKLVGFSKLSSDKKQSKPEKLYLGSGEVLNDDDDENYDE